MGDELEQNPLPAVTVFGYPICRYITPSRAILIVLPFAVALSIVFYVLIHSVIHEVLPDNGSHFGVDVLITALSVFATAAPLILYCARLVKSLEETKTHLKNALQTAEAATSAKSSFLANMSHEIRTPLNGVLGMADALSQHRLPPAQADCVNTIRESGKTLMTILNDVLDLSKIEAGKLDVVPIEADLHHVFSSLRKLFIQRAMEKGIELRIEFTGEVPKRLRFDTVRVRQCVSNLISNAVKFTSHGHATIRVDCKPQDDGRVQVRVQVIDTGMGMAPGVLEKLFSDYVQADTSVSRRFGGTGLGIAIARKLAKLMDGDLTAASIPGEGAVFTLTFLADPAQPIVFPGNSGEKSGDSQPALPKENDPSHSLIFGARMLIVDDNAVNRRVVGMLLKPAKMVITEVENGREALEQLAISSFDIVLLDIHMPVMDGIETIQAIRSSTNPWRNIPVIALTADVMGYTRERLLSLGMSGYAVKPIDQRALFSEIGRVLSDAQYRAPDIPDHRVREPA